MSARISRHLESYRGVSAAVPGPGTVASRSPYPNFGLLVLVENGGNGNYNSLGSKLTKRYSNGVTALVSYTWSKSIDDTSGIRTSDSDTLFSQDGYCMRCERGLSAFDNRHRLVISGLYDLPLGKGRKRGHPQPLPRWRSGRLAAGLHRDLALRIPHQPDRRRQPRQHEHRERPPRRHRPKRIARTTPTTDQWFNTAAFALQPIYKFGNAGRNTVLGPRGFYLDFSTHKDFRIKEGHELQFRWEAFNLLNHPVWGFPNTSLSSPNFGRITSTNGSMRQMQFALKYVF